MSATSVRSAALASGRGSGSVVASALRRSLWRGVLTLTGGHSVTGVLPEGGCVVVANHASHADSAAIVAALPASSRPVVLAAADYWGATRLRGWACRRLMGGLPVRRGGGGSVDLEVAASLLARGRAVVVFPEGTRSRTGEIGAFHAGAFRLAETAGVPVVPLGLKGTGRLLGAHQAPRPGPISVAIGAPSAPNAVAARKSVITLASGPVPAPDSRLRQRVARFAMSWRAVVLVAAWAAAESLSWPLLTELLLAVLVVAAPRRALVLGLTAAVASMVGGLLAYAVVTAGVQPPQPLVTARMQATVVSETSRDGSAAVRAQALNGIPFKVYVVEAARQGVDPMTFTTNAAAARGVRIVVVSLVLGVVAAAARRLRRFYPAYVVLLLSGFGLGLAQVVISWN